jgi:hypothetical protein
MMNHTRQVLGPACPRKGGQTETRKDNAMVALFPKTPATMRVPVATQDRHLCGDVRVRAC